MNSSERTKKRNKLYNKYKKNASGGVLGIPNFGIKDAIKDRLLSRDGREISVNNPYYNRKDLEDHYKRKRQEQFKYEPYDMVSYNDVAESRRPSDKSGFEMRAMGRGRRRSLMHQLEGEGIWEDMNAWGRQNEYNFNKFGRDTEAAFKNAGVQMNAWGRRNQEAVMRALSDPRVMAILNDPEVQKLGKAAVKMAVQYIPVIGPPAANVLGLLGFGKPRGRRSLKYEPLEGDGIWEDMNAWGRQNEYNFNKFGRDTEAAFKNAGVQMNAWGRRNQEAVMRALSDPRVMAVLNDPEVQKLGKAAIKMAVQYIPVIGPPAANVLGLLGFGKKDMIAIGGAMGGAMGGSDPREYRRPSHTARALQLRMANDRGIEVSDAKGEYGNRTRGTGSTGGYVYRPSTQTSGGASGGARSARAEIVKKIMSERGVGMIEASRIVKSEGLY
jgi:uncharacterized protein YjgD (DUF1641 family)